jgi:hypothetical protein
MIIDCHCDAGKGDVLTGSWDTAAALDKYVRRAREAGIDKTVVIALFIPTYAIANKQVAKIVRTQPDRFFDLRPCGSRSRWYRKNGGACRRTPRFFRDQAAPL